MGRRPLDPPPPVDSSQGCLACWTYRVWFWFFFQKNSPWRFGPSRRPPVRDLKDLPGPQFPNFPPPPRPVRRPRHRPIPKKSSKTAQDGLQDGHVGPRWLPKWSKMASNSAQDGPRRPPRRPKGVQDTSKFAQEASKTAQEASSGPPGGPEEAKIIDFP